MGERGGIGSLKGEFGRRGEGRGGGSSRTKRSPAIPRISRVSVRVVDDDASFAMPRGVARHRRAARASRSRRLVAKRVEWGGGELRGGAGEGGGVGGRGGGVAGVPPRSHERSPIDLRAGRRVDATRAAGRGQSASRGRGPRLHGLGSIGEEVVGVLGGLGGVRAGRVPHPVRSRWGILGVGYCVREADGVRGVGGGSVWREWGEGRGWGGGRPEGSGLICRGQCPTPGEGGTWPRSIEGGSQESEGGWWAGGCRRRRQGWREREGRVGVGVGGGVRSAGGIIGPSVCMGRRRGVVEGGRAGRQIGRGRGRGARGKGGWRARGSDGPRRRHEEEG